MSVIDSDQGIRLRLRRELRATPEEVFDALVNPDKQRAWLSEADADSVETSVDLRVGGAWEARFRPNPGTQVHDVQTYVEIDRPHRLVTDVVSEATMGGQQIPTLRSRIELRFVETPAGTLVDVEHSGFPSVETRDFYEAVVWPGGFDRIEAFLASR